MPYPSVDLSQIRTYPVVRRENLVALDDFISPASPLLPFDNPELAEVGARIIAARSRGRPVIWMLGGHVVKCGLAPVLIDLMERGVITHLASNGAATIHDFEIAMLGHTSEDVAVSIEDGSFGMAEETGATMNRAIRQGARDGLGMGEALGRWLAAPLTPQLWGESARGAEEPFSPPLSSGERFPHRACSLLYNAYRLGIPYTVHVAIGTDIIHQHPECDFAATGFATGQDFKIFCASVCDLEGGVFCNFGSAVIGPEVFLKALSVARNLGHALREITTANFDLVPLEPDYRRPAPKDRPEYYYRPKKNIVIRPVSLGGRGYHIVGDHRATIPNLARLVSGEEGERGRRGDTETRLTNNMGSPRHGDAQDQETSSTVTLSGSLTESSQRQDASEASPIDNPQSPDSLLPAFRLLSVAFRTGGTLFLCGNGGSFADALHIAGELDKSFLLPRAIPEAHRQRLSVERDGEALAGALQRGLRTIALGANPSLASAVENDSPQRGMGFAQELYALARPGDVLLAISTSGEAQNVLNAVSAAKALGLSVIALTGERVSRLSAAADVVLRAPASATAEVQEWHIRMYHALCEMLEADAFGSSAPPG
jgi:phosphoheptose isomerase